MRMSISAMMILVMLGLGTYMTATTVWTLWGGSHDTNLMVTGDIDGARIETYTRRDEFGRPTCRRNTSGDPQRQVVRIGHQCP